MKYQGGFVGLLVLLFAAGLIAFWAVRSLTNIYQPEGGNVIKEGYSAIDAAEAAKRLIESRSR